MHTHRLPGLVLTDHEFSVPLDHSRPDGETIVLFAREVAAPDKHDAKLPWLVFMQGGPGFGAPRPDSSSGWLNRALKEYHVLLLDARGTGLSSPVNHQSLAQFGSPQAQADYLKHFRADAIVKDAEWIRHELNGGEKWSVLGQSFGGFCAVHYLSSAPEGLREVFITGGLPPLDRTADDVYRSTYRRVIDKNRLYYERYPEDVGRAHRIAAHLANREVFLPDGERLSPRRFQQLGFAFGMSYGFEQVHYLLEEAFVSGAHGIEINDSFLRNFENQQPFETNPIFAILHEPIYCQREASRWSAQRVRAEYPDFEIAPDRPVYFTGEMIYPWMFEEYRHLRALKGAAEILAAFEGWPALYDKQSLRNNSVPCAAVIYANDMYVERTFSEETAQAINGMRIWLTNEYEHNGLRSYGETVLGRLLDMLHN